jgi:hypothetical protein
MMTVKSAEPIDLAAAARGLLALLPSRLLSQSRGLDGSAESLDALEAWLLQRYGSVADARPDSEAFVVGAAARYVGETFRSRVGGLWRLEDADPSMVFFGLPVITGGALGHSTRCPRSYITAALDRRTGTYLSGLYQALPLATPRPMH